MKFDSLYINTEGQMTGYENSPDALGDMAKAERNLLSRITRHVKRYILANGWGPATHGVACTALVNRTVVHVLTGEEFADIESKAWNKGAKDERERIRRFLLGD